MVKHLPVVNEAAKDCRYGLMDKTPTEFVITLVVVVPIDPSSMLKVPEYVAVGATLI
jgi:hypothetical protein